jgi:hypothetical protein
MGVLLGGQFDRAQKHNLYRCLDKLLLAGPARLMPGNTSDKTTLRDFLLKRLMSIHGGLWTGCSWRDTDRSNPESQKKRRKAARGAYGRHRPIALGPPASADKDRVSRTGTPTGNIGERD